MLTQPSSSWQEKVGLPSVFTQPDFVLWSEKYVVMVVLHITHTLFLRLFWLYLICICTHYKFRVSCKWNCEVSGGFHKQGKSGFHRPVVGGLLPLSPRFPVLHSECELQCILTFCGVGQRAKWLIICKIAYIPSPHVSVSIVYLEVWFYNIIVTIFFCM